MVRRVAWDQRTDRSRLLSRPLQGVIEGFHTAPTIEVRDRAIDAQMFREHMERLRNISIPLGAGEDTITLDGASLGVEIIRARERVVVEWRDLPPEWQPLASWREELRTWLDEVCAAPLAPRGASLSP